MKTGCHLTYTGPGRIIISRGNPRGVPGGYRKFMPLAPSAETFSVEGIDAYRPLFEAQLALLDAQATWDHLHRLAEGVEPVLCCFERPPFTKANFCHRRMVADWFGRELGVTVHEIGHDAQRTLAL